MPFICVVTAGRAHRVLATRTSQRFNFSRGGVDPCTQWAGADSAAHPWGVCMHRTLWERETVTAPSDSAVVGASTGEATAGKQPGTILGPSTNTRTSAAAPSCLFTSFDWARNYSLRY